MTVTLRALRRVFGKGALLVLRADRSLRELCFRVPGLCRLPVPAAVFLVPVGLGSQKPQGDGDLRLGLRFCLQPEAVAEKRPDQATELFVCKAAGEIVCLPE